MTSSSSSSFLPNDSTPTPALLMLPYGYSNGRQRGGFHFALGNNQVIYMTSSDSAGSASLPKLRLFSFAPVLITSDNWPPIFFKHRFFKHWIFSTLPDDDSDRGPDDGNPLRK